MRAYFIDKEGRIQPRDVPDDLMRYIITPEPMLHLGSCTYAEDIPPEPLFETRHFKHIGTVNNIAIYGEV